MPRKINVYYLGKVYFMFHCKVVYKYHYKKERLRGKSYVNPREECEFQLFSSDFSLSQLKKSLKFFVIYNESTIFAAR